MRVSKALWAGFILVCGMRLVGVHVRAVIAKSRPNISLSDDVSKWKSFTNRAGWSIKYPSDWSIGSCNNCNDPTDPSVFVNLFPPSGHELITIDHLTDKPPDRSIDDWLVQLSKQTVANPRLNEEWGFLDGVRSLKVKNRSPGTGISENLYFVKGSKSFAIRASNTMDASFYSLYQQALSTFRFTDH